MSETPTALSLLKGRFPDFCRAYVENGNNGTQAAIEAGYAEGSARKRAYVLLKRKSIQDAIAELRETARRIMDTDIEEFARDIVNDIEDAKAAGQHTAVPKSRELLGKILGHVVDRREIRGQIDLSLTDGRTDAELLEAAMPALIAQGLAPPDFLDRAPARTPAMIEGAVIPPDGPHPPLNPDARKLSPGTLVQKKNSRGPSPDA